MKMQNEVLSIDISSAVTNELSLLVDKICLLWDVSVSSVSKSIIFCKMLNSKGKNITIYGKGKVGTGLQNLASHIGLSTKMMDDQDAHFSAAEHDILIPSPGIPPNNRAYSGHNTISELDFAYRYLPKGFKIIAITGTDGKSTTAWITYELLRKEFGESLVFLSGNFEIPLSETVKIIRERGLKRGYVVVEVSSFMANGIGSHLELLDTLPEGARHGPFMADYTIFTNFETDHLDWHGCIEAYFQAKMNLIHHTKSRVIAHESLKSKGTFPDITRWYGKSE
jgi:UDP-N-acetylmuramoylalanine-D-glutamate ligase